MVIYDTMYSQPINNVAILFNENYVMIETMAAAGRLNYDCAIFNGSQFPLTKWETQMIAMTNNPGVDRVDGGRRCQYKMNQINTNKRNTNMVHKYIDNKK